MPKQKRKREMTPDARNGMSDENDYRMSWRTEMFVPKRFLSVAEHRRLKRYRERDSLATNVNTRELNDFTRVIRLSGLVTVAADKVGSRFGFLAFGTCSGYTLIVDIQGKQHLPERGIPRDLYRAIDSEDVHLVVTDEEAREKSIKALPYIAKDKYIIITDVYDKRNLKDLKLDWKPDPIGQLSKAIFKFNYRIARNPVGEQLEPDDKTFLRNETMFPFVILWDVIDDLLPGEERPKSVRAGFNKSHIKSLGIWTPYSDDRRREVYRSYLYDNQHQPHWSYKEPIPEPPKEDRTTYLIGHRKDGSTTQGETIKIEASPQAAESMNVTGVIHGELNRSYFRSWYHNPPATYSEEPGPSRSPQDDDLVLQISQQEEEEILAETTSRNDDRPDLREVINKKKRKKQHKVLTQWLTHTCSRCHQKDDMRISTMGTGMGTRFLFTESRQVTLDITDSSSEASISDTETVIHKDP